jgi:hypothetical protein
MEPLIHKRPLSEESLQKTIKDAHLGNKFRLVL